MKNRLRGILLPILFALPLPLTVQAAVYCVTNSTELQQALTQAAASSADDEIRLLRGVYTAQQTFTYIASTSGWLYINGGWEQVGNNNCGQRNPSAAMTILDGAGQRQVLNLFHSPPADSTSATRFIVENLSFRSGVGEGFVRGGGLSMYSSAESHTEFFLDNLIIANNSGYFGGGASLTVQNGLIRIANSLFSNNSAPTSAFGHAAINVPRTSASSGLVIANSTFANGTCLGNTGGQRGCGLGIGIGGTVRMDLVNSLFDNNALSDLSVEGMVAAGLGVGNAHYSYSRVPVSDGSLVPTVSNALVGDPRFVDAPNQDFRLRDDSPFINRGLAAVPLYPANSFDLAGNLRVRFGALDAGAYENQTWDFIFSNGFQ